MTERSNKNKRVEFYHILFLSSFDLVGWCSHNPEFVNPHKVTSWNHKVDWYTPEKDNERNKGTGKRRKYQSGQS